MASEPTTAERMSAERIASLVLHNNLGTEVSRRDVSDLLAEVSALSAELEAARATALEEAAAIADRCWIDNKWPAHVRVDVDGGSLTIAEAIRALKGKP